MRKNILVLLILVLTFTLNSFTVSADSVNFSDVEGHWAEPAIKAMAKEGTIKGYPDGSFKPDGQVTRAEALSLVMRLNREKPASNNDVKAVDTKPTDWFYSDLDGYLDKYNTRYNILNGNRFDPNVKATRGFMVGVLSAAIVDDLPLPGSGTTDFIDIDEVPEDLKDRLRKLSNMNVISGYLDRSFRPNNNISRAEVATILYKLDSKRSSEEEVDEQKSPEYEKGLKEADQLFEEIYEGIKKDCFDQEVVMGENRNNILIRGHVANSVGSRIRYKVLIEKIIHSNGIWEFRVTIRYFNSENDKIKTHDDWLLPSKKTNVMNMIKANAPQ